eukprot:2563365-Alexandrium_andersonii.AAC.1
MSASLVGSEMCIRDSLASDFAVRPSLVSTGRFRPACVLFPRCRHCLRQTGLRGEIAMQNELLGRPTEVLAIVTSSKVSASSDGE